jgi:hypothetical protein
MITITKYDMRHVIDHAECPAHYWTVFNELVEVYEPKVDLTLDDMLKPFARKKFAYKIPAQGVMRDPDNVKYADYLIPLFYSAYVLQCVAYKNVIKDVLVRILTDNGHFQLSEEKKTEWNDLWGGDNHFYWPLARLTEKEQVLSDELFQDYLNIKKQ